MSFLTDITSTGVSFAKNNSEKRNIILSNYISIIIGCAPPLLVIGALILSDPNDFHILMLIVASLICVVPIIANRLGYVNFSRIVLCWLPSIIIFAESIIDIKTGSRMSASSYVGLRLFLIPAGCFPFLVFNLKDRGLILGYLGPLLSLLLFDPIFTFFKAAYWQRNAFDPLYTFNNIRAVIAFGIIGLSCYMLKLIVERNENLNQKLVSELAEKNALIQRQADDEVHELNRKLKSNLKQLKEREFILNQSQRIAKIGSWEYTLDNDFLFCSDEIYNMFGLDHEFVFNVKTLSNVFLREDSKILIDATNILFQTDQPFDLTLRALTPFGYIKWIRVSAFPVKRNNKILGVTGICHDITYFRESEELLRTSENKYRSLFEQASDFIMIADFTGKILDVNASLCAAFEYSKDELVHMNIEPLIDPDELEVRSLPFSALSNGEYFLTERRMLKKDKTIITVESNVRKLDEGRILIIARDVTRLREAQRDIEVSEARFRGAFEYSAIGMALVSLQLKWLKVNKELCFILGYSEDELLKLTDPNVTHPDDQEKDFESLQKILDGKIDTFHREKRYIHKNGSVLWTNLNVSLIKDNNGEPLYFVSQIEDITTEKKAEEQLLLSQANLNATINNTEVLIWSIDRSQRLLMFNNPFYYYMKHYYGIEISIGSPVFEQNTEGGKMAYNNWNNYFTRVFSGESFTLEETNFGIDFHYSISPISEAGNIIGASVFADNITARKIQDRELAEANKKVGEFKLMALRSVMSPHFIFNVLNSIQFYIAKSDRLNAINYLSTFSKLIRSILTHSVDNKIKLMDEIEMLKNYILLEMTRFEQKFNLVFDVDPLIEVASVQIPSLLIQPYVENAILHGLYNKKEPGTLTIRIRELEESIVFEIEDNGIGRDAALKLRQQNFPTHKSMGIRLTEERLKLINLQHHTAFEIVDLVDENGEAAGTKVIIRITI